MTTTQEPTVAAPAEARALVREMLSRADAFQGLDAGERRRLANGLVKVLAFLTDETGGLPERGAPTATALDDASDALRARLAAKPTLVGKEFQAGAATAAGRTFKTLVAAVDFPKFVSGLIEGVYTSIVNSSIRQMQEYGKFLEAIVKSVEEFAQDHVTLDQARDFVASSYPRAVEVDRSGDRATLRLKDGIDDKDVPDFKTAFGVDGEASLDDEDSELKVVLGAQLKMARQRQQQLATMVLMGINRIIVTEGEIKASVMFDVKSRDTAQRDSYASSYDESRSEQTSGGGFWDSDSNVQTTVSSAYAEEKDRSTADLEAKAKLSGSVTVRFKSETFPLERLASSAEFGAVQQKGAR